MGIEDKKDQGYDPNRPTRMDIFLQFLGDRMRLGSPAVIIINLAMRIGAPIAMFFDRFHRNEEILDKSEEDKENEDREDLFFI